METDAGGLMRVEVLYAQPDAIWRRVVELPAGTTAEQAFRACGLAESHPELAAGLPPLGIYGRVCAPGHVMQPGDRLEVYRPLVFDPMESRRRRMRHRERRSQPKLSGT